ncbi:MAG: hypothetical protein WC858_02345 [Parcubacteria group bacterium]|jgi:hypothetical protein
MTLAPRKQISLKQMSQLINRSEVHLWQICYAAFQQILNNLGLFGELAELIAAGVPPEKLKPTSRQLHVETFFSPYLPLMFSPMAYGACHLAIALGYRGDSLKDMFGHLKTYSGLSQILALLNRKSRYDETLGLAQTSIGKTCSPNGVELIWNWIPAILPNMWDKSFWKEMVQSPFLPQTYLHREEIVECLQKGCGANAHLVLFPAAYKSPWRNHLELRQEKLLSHQAEEFRRCDINSTLRWATLAEAVFLIMSSWLAANHNLVDSKRYIVRAPLVAFDNDSPFYDLQVSVEDPKKKTITIGHPGSFGGCHYAIPLLVIC